MEIEGSSGVKHRKLKVDAYRSAHRLLRIANRKFRKERDDLVAVALMAQSEPCEKDEDKKEEERIERIDKNKEWRKRREMQKWESCGLDPPADPKIEKEKNRKIARKFEKQLCSELICSNCRYELLGEVWECFDGHPTCGDCFDRENMGVDLNIQRKSSTSSERSDLLDVLENINSCGKSRNSSSSLSTKSIDSLKKGLSTSSIATFSSIETIASLRESLGDIAEGDEDAKSWVKYKVNEIDFFLGTLEVRKDAIACYMDYNNAFKSIFYNPDLEGLSLNGDSNVGIGSNEYKDEKSERVMKYIERLRDEGALAALRETLIDVIETEDEDIDPSWAKFRLEELDFFLNTLNIRKDAITYYGDYHNDFRSIFFVENYEEGDQLMNETEDDTDDEDDDEADSEPRITKCKSCRKFILKRNYQVEKLAKIFFQVE